MSKMKFIAGMPRSGSTLLCNIISQNPKFGATGTSPLPQLLTANIQLWASSNECKANYTDDDKFYFLRKIMDHYHRPLEVDTIFDKSRAWPSYVELLEAILGERPKILVCTRYMPAIASSFEKIWRKEIVQHGVIPQGMLTLEDRLKYWMGNTQIIGSAYASLKDSSQRGNNDCFHRVDFFDLTTDPKTTLQKIHDFVEEPWFDYNFNNINQVIHEKDEFHGFSKDALHKIRSKVEPVRPDFVEVIGQDFTNQLSVFDYDFLNQ